MATRRSFLERATHTCAAALTGGALASATLNAAQAQTQPQSSTTPSGQRFLLTGLVGSENPTRANFPFVWAVALKQAGHEVRIDLAGDATVLMRTPVSNSVTPVGWPAFKETLAKVVDLKIPIYV
ncbi:MAG TPA: hypothetical protein VF840_06370 [Terriglobales bacterium]